MSDPHYYISPVVRNMDQQKWFGIVEEVNGQQVTIALVPFNHLTRDGYTLARKDAQKIINALNYYEECIFEDDFGL